MYALVIVDMQPKFKASNDIRCIANCVREVRKAIECGATIIVLEYSRRGNERGHKTHEAIRKLVQAYENSFFIIKNEDDGSHAIYAQDVKLDPDNLHFRLCGVNLGACVRSTAIGLREYFPDAHIEIIADAVNQPKEWEKSYGGYENHGFIPANILQDLEQRFNVCAV